MAAQRTSRFAVDRDIAVTDEIEAQFGYHCICHEILVAAIRYAELTARGEGCRRSIDRGVELETASETVLAEQRQIGEIGHPAKRVF